MRRAIPIVFLLLGTFFYFQAAQADIIVGPTQCPNGEDPVLCSFSRNDDLAVKCKKYNATRGYFELNRYGNARTGGGTVYYCKGSPIGGTTTTEDEAEEAPLQNQFTKKTMAVGAVALAALVFLFLMRFLMIRKQRS